MCGTLQRSLKNESLEVQTIVSYPSCLHSDRANRLQHGQLSFSFSLCPLGDGHQQRVKVLVRSGPQVCPNCGVRMGFDRVGIKMEWGRVEPHTRLSESSVFREESVAKSVGLSERDGLLSECF